MGAPLNAINFPSTQTRAHIYVVYQHAAYARLKSNDAGVGVTRRAYAKYRRLIEQNNFGQDI